MSDPSSQTSSPAAADRLSGVDTAWLRMDDPTNLMVINGVFVFASPVDFDRLRGVIDERLVAIDRFRKRVVASERGRPRWEHDPDFDLDRHLTHGPIPEPGDEAALRALVSERMSEPLDPDHPLWHFHLAEGYRGGAALIGRLHHCIGDGIALMLVTLSLADVDPAGPADGGATNPFGALFRETGMEMERARAAAEEIMPEGVRLMTKPAEVLERTKAWVRGVVGTGAFGRMALRPPDPKTAFKGSLGVEKRAAWSDPVPMEQVRRVKQALGATVNDVLLTAMTGGLRRYLADRGEPVEGVKFRATVPVSLRPLDRMADLGNEFGLVFLKLPVGIADPRERLAELRRRMGKLKRSTESLVVLKVLEALGRAPEPLQRLVVNIFGSKATAVMTNVPGPRERLYMAGEPIEDIFFWVPQAGHLGMGISILSYAGRVRLGVATDAGLVPDPERIVEAFHDELEVLAGLAASSADSPSPDPR